MKELEVTPASLYLLDKLLPGVNRKFIPHIIFAGIVTVSLIVRLTFVSSIPLHIQIIMVFTQFTFLEILWLYLTHVNSFFDKIWPYARLTIARFLTQLLVSFLGYTLLRSIVFWLFVEYLPVKEPDTVKIIAYVIDFIVTIAINIGFLAFYLLNQWRDTWVQAQRLAKENTQVQYDNLKNQLNPHFLFNSLTSLNSLIYKDQELASKFLQQLSKVYRYLLENRQRETVSIRTELEFVAHFVDLLKTRFGEALQIKIEVSGESLDGRIVPVSLQIMIENALKHNVLSPQHPLIISMAVADSCLLIRNNVQLKEQVDTSNKIGLQNFARLYSFLSEYPVTWKNEEGQFEVKIPLLN